jgi:hypothetical protein
MKTDQISEPLITFFGMKSASDVDDPKFHPLFGDAYTSISGSEFHHEEVNGYQQMH